MGAFQSLPTDSAESFPDLVIDTTLERGAKPPEWSEGNSATLTVFSLRETELYANELIVVETGVRFRLNYMLTMLVLPHEAIIDKAQTMHSAICCDCADANPTLVYVPDNDSTPTFTIAKHAPVAKLLILPVARPKLQISMGKFDQKRAACAEEAAQALLSAQKAETEDDRV